MRDMKLGKLEILDCTIRDGGYLNNWNFDENTVKEIYRNISKTGVDIIEIGYKNIPKAETGIWYSTTEELINRVFNNISGVPLSLMIDYDNSDISNIPDADKSIVKLYRVACHKDKIIGALELCSKIKDKGYKVSIQLMGIVGYSDQEVGDIIKPLLKSVVDYIYFADSYGSLFPKDISKYINILRSTKKKIGFHPHNALQLAFANTLEAIHNGIDIVDGTIYGMGRGAGNLPIEVLLIYLEKTLDHKKYNSMPVMDLIDRYFNELKSKLNWGYNLPFMLSGIFEVHPNYAKEMVDRREYSVDDIARVLEVIKSIGPVGYKKDVMDNIIKSGFVAPVSIPEETKEDTLELKKELLGKYGVNGTAEYKDKHKDRDFLILANGPSLKEHKFEIKKFIEKHRPIIMGANYLGELGELFKPDYHAFSNKKRFQDYVSLINLSRPQGPAKLLLSASFDDKFIKEYYKKGHFERILHLNRVSNDFDIDKNGVINSNCRTVSVLLVAVAIVMGAKRIFIAGMDGYKNKENFLLKRTHFYHEPEEAETFEQLIEKHNQNDSMLKAINTYLIKSEREGLHIITPTSHKHFYNSVFNWIK